MLLRDLGVLSGENPTMANTSATGATPEGAGDPQSAAAAVRDMFSAIAPRYDLLNHILSMNVDRLWWQRAAKAFAHILTNPHAVVLDLCCGTGDMAFALNGKGKGAARIVGADFSHPMLQRASVKSRGTPLRWIEADALRLPFADASFDLVTSAFGFRNLVDYNAGLCEIARVLKPGGECGILDFGEPKGVVGKLYRVYFWHCLPKIATLISGVKGPYSYLPASVQKFPPPEEMLNRMRKTGFHDCSWTAYTFGIAGLYRGKV